MRTHYRNGDEVSLRHHGCDGCSPATINGRFWHETACPFEYKDVEQNCFECGCRFFGEVARQYACPDCMNPEEPEESLDPTCGWCGAILAGGECTECTPCDCAKCQQERLTERTRKHTLPQ